MTRLEGENPCEKFNPSEEVDFVVIGSGAAGGVMAKQLAVAGFSVVVMEQGSWGAYGHEQDYTKDELSNRFPTEQDMLISDPGKKQRNTFRRNASAKRRLPAAIAMVAWWGAAPSPMAHRAGGTCPMSSTKPASSAPWPAPALPTGR